MKAMEAAGAEMLEKHNQRDAMMDKVKTLEDANAKLLKEIEGFGVTIKKQGLELRSRDETIKLLGDSLDKECREADKARIYKEMYDALLDKIISARGGSANE